VSSLYILAVLLIAGVIAYLVGRIRSIRTCKGEQRALHSRPSYYGYYLAIWTVLPAIFALALWSAAERPVTNYLAEQEIPQSVL
jgi:phosphate transport system permease protein